MRLNPGTRLGPYEVVAPIGAGGMGEVYRARDTRLGRDVAIKVLPQHLSENPDVHARFEREARTVSSLNHPHICTLFDVGHEDGVEYLVMEMIEGDTLAQRLEKGPLPIPEVLRLGHQIADALDRAHRAGIVHRDLKPGNIMLTRAGAKLMDFGLARATQAATATSASGATIAHLSHSPTVASPLTAEGTLVGTFLYMPPEQLEGREADARSDLWAFGCVLYEMATGKRAFEGRTQASLIGSIMHSEPQPLATAAPAAPPQLDALIRACLAKDPEERVQTAHDAKLQLSWIAQAGSQSGVAAPAIPAAPRRGFPREALAWGVAVAAVAAAGWFALRGAGAGATQGTADQQIRFTIPIPRLVRTADMPRISPDGRILAFSAQDSAGREMIWVRPLNSLTANPLPGTEGSGRPFWSPDSRFLGFFADGKLKKVAVAGGPADVICDAPTGADGAWGSRGVILYDGAGADPIRRVNAAGGVPATAMPADSTMQIGWPMFLPDGEHYFYTTLPNDGPPQIMVAKLGEERGRPLGIGGSRVEYSHDGFLVFARERSLLAQRFDARSLELMGEPFPVAEDLPVAGNAQANFTVSTNGVLVFRATGDLTSRLVWLDRDGREVGEVSGPADFRAPALSPRGDRIAIRRTETGGSNLDIWVLEPARGTSTRFTFDPSADGNPIWSPDGSQIAWNSAKGGSEGLWLKSSSGLGEEKQLVQLEAQGIPYDWTRDGRHLLFGMSSGNTSLDVYVLPMDGESKPRVVLQTPFVEGRGRFSPDGRYIAYQSDESGRFEVYVASFEGPAGRWQVSAEGGGDPAWSPDGRELYYIGADQRLMAVPLIPGPTLQPGTPAPLFRVHAEVGLRRNVYEVAPDGKRFLFLVPVGETSTPMTVMVNWRAGIGPK